MADSLPESELEIQEFDTFYSFIGVRSLVAIRHQIARAREDGNNQILGARTYVQASLRPSGEDIEQTLANTARTGEARISDIFRRYPDGVMRLQYMSINPDYESCMREGNTHADLVAAPSLLRSFRPEAWDSEAGLTVGDSFAPVNDLDQLGRLHNILKEHIPK